MKASKIRALIFDVDGVLTGGQILYSNSGDELKMFNVKDGQIIKYLRGSGISLGAITGRSSQLVQRRCEELKLDFFHQGVKDKWSVLKEEIGKLSINKDQVCYIGDDLVDLESLVQVGFGAVPSDAVEYIKEHVDLVAYTKGGEGGLREVADLILASQGGLKDIVEECL